MRELAEDAEDLVTCLNFHIDNLSQATDPDDIAVAADSACTYFQAVAICELLLDDEVDAFLHLMVRSARTRLWLLRRAKGQVDYPGTIMKPSNTRGLFAAVLSKDWMLAREIAELSPTVWDDQIEYENDHRYARFLHRRLAGDPVPVQRTLLHEYARSLDGDEPPRFRLCRALLDADRAEARKAFADLLHERKAELEELAETQGGDELFTPLASIYVEGLAWLRLLEAAGLPTKKEYPLCPRLARPDTVPPYVPDGFPD
jgi:hypothetical protein